MELLESKLSWDSDIEQLEAGISTVGDVQQAIGEDLVGIFDRGHCKVFVSRKARNEVMKLLGVTDEGNKILTIPSIGRIEVHELGDFDLSTQLEPNITLVAQNYQCQKFEKNLCINFYYTTGGFAFSWKTTEDLYLCKKKKGDYCAFTANKVQLQAHKQKDCKGPMQQVSTTWKFCSPV
ncbi:MAG: hypothetical protein HKP41_14300 [Desulfobacterales bacterium]|nr:hypothetical protein [Deltaproteobacteria bacterium]NNK95518.1 hypothetical protein [Desulfobacterales bacterium]